MSARTSDSYFAERWQALVTPFPILRWVNGKPVATDKPRQRKPNRRSAAVQRAYRERVQRQAAEAKATAASRRLERSLRPSTSSGA
jgi:hypothetical protein